MDFIYQLGGVQKRSQDDTDPGRVPQRPEGAIEWAPPTKPARASPRSRSNRTIFGEAFSFLRDTVTTAVPKLTIPSLSMVHYRGGRSAIDKSVYPDLDQFWADLAATYAEEVRRLYQLGCRYLQFDDTSLAYMNDPASAGMSRRSAATPSTSTSATSRTSTGRWPAAPADLAVTTHMCRGNNQSMWAAAGGYEFVADALFNELAVDDGFHGSGTEERRAGFERLRSVPKATRRPRAGHHQARGELESKDQLKRRIDDAARFVDAEQLCLSPQCGFSSTKQGQLPHAGSAVGQAPADRRDRAGGLELLSPECDRGHISRDRVSRPAGRRDGLRLRDWLAPGDELGAHLEPGWRPARRWPR